MKILSLPTITFCSSKRLSSISIALDNSNITITDSAQSMIGGIDCKAISDIEKEELLHPIAVSVKSLELDKKGGSLKRIYESALGSGLKLFTPKIALEFRLQYHDQPRGKWLPIAMEPIHGRIFIIGSNQTGLWLQGEKGHTETFWWSKCEFIFLQ